jgi:hypothetical protein
LNVVSTGAGEPLGQRPHLVTGLTGAVPGDENRSHASFDQRAGPGKLLLSRPGTPPGYPALRLLRRGVAGLGLHLVGKDQMGHPAGITRMLHRQRRQFGVVTVAVRCRRPGGHVPEDHAQVKVLERAAAKFPGGDLAGNRQHRRLVQLGVVQAGEHVRRARAGDREACGRAVSLP